MERTQYRSSLTTVLTIVAEIFLITNLTSAAALSLPTAGRDVAMSLMPNVVRIEARTQEHTDSGFGFIVGERAGVVYIVTAYHVVSNPQDVGQNQAVTVTVEFYELQGDPRRATLLGTHDVDHDLAVLTVQLPPGLKWRRAALGRDDQQKEATEVWFIGRTQRWYVPVSPGHIGSDPSIDWRIDLEGLPIRPGSSGGPLIASSGIVGMILRDSAEFSNALSITFIKAAFKQWNHPWGLEFADGSSTQSFATAINSARAGLSTKNVALFYVELVSPLGDPFVPVEIYLPSSTGITANDADTLFGAVEDAAGAKLISFEDPVKLTATNADFFADKTLELSPGKYTLVLGLGKNGRAVAEASMAMEIKGMGDVSRLVLSENVYELDAAQPTKAPFAFGKLKIVPKANLIFSAKSDLNYFVEIRNPGIDSATKLAKLQYKLALSGGPSNKTIAAPLKDAEALPLSGTPGPGPFAIIAAIPLGDIKPPLLPGDYTLKMNVVDTISKQTVEVMQSFQIRE